MAQDDSWWKDAPIVSAGGGGGPLPSPPKEPKDPPAPKTTYRTLTPDDVKARGLEPGVYQESSEGKLDKAGDAPDPIAGDQKTSALTKLRNVINKIDTVAFDANDNGGWGETGMTGSAMRNVPGTAGYDLAANVETLDANAAFEALAEMRRNSPTGGALGQVTERELDLLRSSIANLNTAQGHPQFLANLLSAKEQWLDMLRKVDPAAAAEYANKPGIYRDDKGTVGFLYQPQSEEDEGLTIDVTDESPSGTPGGDPNGGGNGGPGGTPSGDGGGRYSLGNIAQSLKAGVGDVIEGGGDILGIVTNPLNATVNAATGSNLTTDMGGYLRQQSGMPDGDPTVSAITTTGTAALGFGGAARGVAAQFAPGAAKNALNVVGANPIRDAVAGGSGGLSAEIAQRNDVGPVGQTVAGVAGGMLGYGGATGVTNMFTPKAPTQLAQAATRQGVDMLPADAGGPVAKIVTSGTRASPISATPVAKAAERSQGQMRDAAYRTAASEGDVVPTDVAGEAVTDAAKRLNSKTRDIGNARYNKAWADPIASALTIPPRNALSKIDELITDLRNAPSTNASAITNLQKLRSDLAGGMTAKALHSLRHEIRDGVYDGGLRSSKDQSRMKAIGEAMSDDMLGYLDQTGNKRTADSIRQADRYWKDRVEHIDQVLQPLIGRDGQKGGEQIVQALETMARGNFGGNKRLGRLLKEMTPEEAGNVRATIIDRIGKATPGQQTAEGGAFSPATFLTNWNRMTPQAKETLFSNKALRQNLDDIALLSERMKASQAMSNHSNTSLAAQGSVGLQLGWAVSHFPSFLMGSVAQYGTGKLMASPGFARWLAKAPERTSEQAARKYSEQLGVLATREPLIAMDAKALQQHLQQAIGQSPTRAAAGEEEQD